MKFANNLLLRCFCTALLTLVILNPTSATSRIPAEPFSLNRLEGTTVALDDFKGQVLLVNFWATWCPPCVHELPSMQTLHDTFHDQSFEILAMNMGERPKDIENFLSSFSTSIGFPILLNADLNVAKKWNVRAMPTSVVIDKQGNIVETFVGPKDWFTDDTRSLISALIAE